MRLFKEKVSPEKLAAILYSAAETWTSEFVEDKHAIENLEIKNTNNAYYEVLILYLYAAIDVVCRSSEKDLEKERVAGKILDFLLRMCSDAGFDENQLSAIKKLFDYRMEEYTELFYYCGGDTQKIMKFSRIALSNILGEETFDAVRSLNFFTQFISVYKLFPDLVSKYKIIE